MNKQEIKNFLKENTGYLKKGSEFLSEKFNCSVETCKLALRESRAELKGDDFDIDNDNETKLSAYKTFLQVNEIEEDSVASVKYWQNMSGDYRFSVVQTNGDDNSQLLKIKEEILGAIESYSPTVESEYKVSDDPCMIEISLPDIHYGKGPLEEIEEDYMNSIKDLMEKAKGLNFEKIWLPIGNDGMNSEGFSRSTTKGTPQFDSADWRETFTGYCALTVRAINYLAEFAPVDVTMIQGNHDFERSFYAGEYLKAWFTNHGDVVVDNSFDTRKYYRYGTSMILTTHGDKEKPAELPLIMATEQPIMFSECTHREVHLGHKHKEQVNEYRGIKVRFIPSICKNDAWHKAMGYEAKRTGQLHIWNYRRGYEGYLQTNL